MPQPLPHLSETPLHIPFRTVYLTYNRGLWSKPRKWLIIIFLSFLVSLLCLFTGASFAYSSTRTAGVSGGQRCWGELAWGWYTFHFQTKQETTPSSPHWKVQVHAYKNWDDTVLERLKSSFYFMLLWFEPENQAIKHN